MRTGPGIAAVQQGSAQVASEIGASTARPSQAIGAVGDASLRAEHLREKPDAYRNCDTSNKTDSAAGVAKTVTARGTRTEPAGMTLAAQSVTSAPVDVLNPISRRPPKNSKCAGTRTSSKSFALGYSTPRRLNDVLRMTPIANGKRPRLPKEELTKVLEEVIEGDRDAVDDRQIQTRIGPMAISMPFARKLTLTSSAQVI
ncbi:MAG: hypothetical protein BJ554DRAFT_6247 [Olpidium bornovanus]|uniref:Uncharacterized protein n=1 Tax=Olpidium bornovanus TaxID=278681 RepID=A0A8H8A2R2_9FUNG|nr:MAG: hypothetical protein BJ554DRAFT_6247 [Olpidium bornovanus]